MLKSCYWLKCQGCSKTQTWKSSAWPAAIAGKTFADKIGTNFDIATKKIKVGVAFIFRHLVQVTALWYKIKVNESCLNNLKLFLAWLSTRIRLYDPLYWKKNKLWRNQTVFWLAQGHLKIFGKLPWWKTWLSRGRKNNFLHDLLSILIILKLK